MIMIDKETRLVGRILTGSPVCVSGAVEGAVECRDRVTVQPEGHWRGRIHARSVWVQGVVDGEIRAEERVVLAAGCHVRGLIRSPRISIAAGARCSAHLVMDGQDETEEPRSLAPSDAIRHCA